MSSPRTARTSISCARAAATSSCVDSGFAAQSATSAPPATSVRIRHAVSAVTCRHAASRDAVERPLLREPLADQAEDGHLPLGPSNTGPAVAGEARIRN